MSGGIGSTPLSRREVLKGAIASGGTVLLAFHLPFAQSARPEGQSAASQRFEPNGFIRIDRQGTITLIMPQVEMGQGIYTGVAMILAEELDVAFEQVVVEAAPPNEQLYRNPALGIQATGGSTSVRAFWKPLRKAGASARAMLVEAAAKSWRVEAAACRTEAGQVIHEPSSRKVAYAALIEHLGNITPPQDPPLKDIKAFRLIGQPLRRLDTPDKVNGKLVYGIDAMPPGVKIATLAISPVLGGKVAHMDEAAARSVPGVRQVVAFDDLVAVVADHMWAAKKGLAALNVQWDPGPHAQIDTNQVWKELRAASERQGAIAQKEGDVAQALSGAGADRVESVYEMPFLAHATMEPLNCAVHVRPDGCEIWVGSQILARAQAVAAKVTGLPLEKVVIHNLLIGGGFGRRLEVDYVERAVQIATRVDGPVKVVWTREEDMQHDVYRPVYHDQLSAALSGSKIVGWKHKVTGSAVIARFLPPAFQKGVDIDAVDSAVDVPYGIPNVQIEYVRQEPTGVPTGFWRGVGPNNNVFAIESFIDELAKKVGQDPVAFRKAHLDKTPRLKAALELVANRAGWGSPLPARRGGRTGRGVSVQTSFGSFIATVAEVEVDEFGEAHVHRFVTAVDTGIVVNPDIVVAQLQGGLIFGLTAALYGQITVEKGRVQQSNFHDYRILRMDQTPVIEVHLIPSAEAPGGIGETGTTTGPPAVRNAIFAATGIPLRRMPIDRDVLAGKKNAAA